MTFPLLHIEKLGLLRHRLYIQFWMHGNLRVIELYFEPRDMWIGLFWKHEKWTKIWDFYICIIPTLPIHLLVNNEPLW